MPPPPVTHTVPAFLAWHCASVAHATHARFTQIGAAALAAQSVLVKHATHTPVPVSHLFLPTTEVQSPSPVH